ncbi:MAG: YfcC family protein [Spirochaetales bacterium]|nr:YfcC family protein [Spirochaetales bacterium]
MSEQTSSAGGSQTTSLKIGKKAFLLAFFILLGLMTISGILTRVIPAGSYQRVAFEGREMVVPGSFEYMDATPPAIIRWYTAPFEVLAAEGNITVITIILFIIFVGGAFSILEIGGVLKALLLMVVERFRHRKYLLMGVIIFFFMFIAAVLGIYESMVPMIVFIVPLAHILGWDSMTGLGMSLLPLAFGFSAAVTNPFTIGVAQSIAELPMFSGAWLRILFFIIVYCLVFFFVRRYAKKVEADHSRSLVHREDETVRALYREMADEKTEDPRTKPGMKGAIRWFTLCMLLAIAFIVVTARIPALSDYAFPLMAFLFLIGGVGSGLMVRMGGRGVISSFSKGMVGILPGILLILMSMSVKHIVSTGGIMDTILYSAGGLISQTGKVISAYLIYLLTLVMNFFIGSASAKAFLMMPILTPLADLVGITRQTAVLAFDFGDGFSNMLYPSNALLLIGLGFTVVSFPKWIRWTIGLQGIIFLLSMVFLTTAVLINFGPF